MVAQTVYNEARTTTDLYRLGELAVDDDYKVRAWVAGNKVCPPEYLAYLSGDTNVTVLGNVAANVNTPSEILGVLARNLSVAHFVSSNPNTSTSTLHEIVGTVIVKLRAGKPFEDIAPIVNRICENPNSDIYTLSKVVDILEPQCATLFNLIVNHSSCTPQLCHTIATKLVDKSYNSHWAKPVHKTEALVAILGKKDLMYDTLKVVATREWSDPKFRKTAIEQMALTGEHEGWPVEWLEEMYA